MKRFGSAAALFGAVLLFLYAGEGLAGLLPLKPLPPLQPLPPLKPLPPLQLAPLPPVLGSQSGLPPPAGALVAEQVRVTADGSAVRHYLLHTPVRPGGFPADAKLPLVLVLHGVTQSAQQMANSASGQIWRLMADGIVPGASEPFYVAFLNGAGAANLATSAQMTSSWNDCDAARVNNLSTANDVAFTRAVVEQLGSKIDPSKVYAYGFSNGATMALRLGREAGDVVAAIVAISGVDPQPVNDECVDAVDGVPLRRPAAIIHGTADILAPFVSNCVTNNPLSGLLATACRLGHAETVTAWKNKSGPTLASDALGLMPPKAAFPKSSSTRPVSVPADTTSISCVQHLSSFQLDGLSPLLVGGQLVPASPSDVRIQDCVITGGGHLEPSILTYAGAAVEAVFGKQNNDAEAVSLAWQFFQRHVK